MPLLPVSEIFHSKESTKLVYSFLVTILKDWRPPSGFFRSSAVGGKKTMASFSSFQKLGNSPPLKACQWSKDNVVHSFWATAAVVSSAISVVSEVDVFFGFSLQLNASTTAAVKIIVFFITQVF